MEPIDIVMWTAILLTFGGYRVYNLLYGESSYSMLNPATWFICAGVRALKLMEALALGNSPADCAFQILLVVIPAIMFVVELIAALKHR